MRNFFAATYSLLLHLANVRLQLALQLFRGGLDLRMAFAPDPTIASRPQGHQLIDLGPLGREFLTVEGDRPEHLAQRRLKVVPRQTLGARLLARLTSSCCVGFGPASSARASRLILRPSKQV